MTPSSGAPLHIVILGASGDLARKKLVPALFALYCQHLLPDDFRVFGLARTPMGDDAFRSLLERHLSCRYTPGASCAERMREFLYRCFYVQGGYDDSDSFLTLFERERDLDGVHANRLFYFALPSTLFVPASTALAGAGLAACVNDEGPWTRAVVEKPFGRDRGSSDALVAAMARIFTEEQTYRMDHYLGKEVIQNLLVLRFANLIFEPLWNNRYVHHVEIRWQEDIGVESRGGYFDNYGIIRDVVQNHLLQILALVAMEPPDRLTAHGIRDGKVRVLRQVPPVAMEDVVVGQYVAAERGGIHLRGYREESGVPPDSRAATFAAARLRIANDRWRGVPFLLRAGKAMGDRLAEVRVRFRDVPSNLFCVREWCPPANELVLRVQPNEAIELTVATKVPGLEMRVAPRPLDLRYQAAFREVIPDAYEQLLLDAIKGDRSLFIRSDELAAAWDILTPVLHAIDHARMEPEPYPFGSAGPAGESRLVAGCEAG
jgi:glucose-6-phosphate 1-dehydrogenase